MSRYDVAVLGLGATGSAALYQLAKRGARVLGIDRYAPPHAHGSTHGDTRITRLAIGEGGHYTPLVMRSHEIWREIERETGISLLSRVGGLIISSESRSSFTHVADFFANTVAAAKKHRIEHEMLDAAAIRRRFPQFHVRDDEIGYYENAAGFVRPEDCVRAQLGLAKRHGADIHTNEEVASFTPDANKVAIATDRATYDADRLIVAAGPWLPQLLGAAFSPLFKVYRQVLFWFVAKGAIEPFLPENFPVFIWELQDRNQGIYGFPAIDGAQGGVKVATEQYEATTTPQTALREIGAREAGAVYESLVAPHLPGLSGECVRAVSCLYTVTPDFGFIVDRHPESERVIIASPCSGHGFKHSAALGQALAELVLDGASRFDLTPFRIGRFGQSAPRRRGT
jgi:sarcosine oxidase